MNDLQKPKREFWWKSISISIAMALLTIFAVLIQRMSYRYEYYHSPHIEFEKIIKEGDDAFKSYQYDYALILYQRADKRLVNLIEFEFESPSKNTPVLQHYYNVRTLLKTRTELALIAKEISRLREQSLNRSSTTANRSDYSTQKKTN